MLMIIMIHMITMIIFMMITRTAVHYLAISPPRIRITDTSRGNSPEGDKYFIIIIIVIIIDKHFNIIIEPASSNNNIFIFLKSIITIYLPNISRFLTAKQLEKVFFKI